MTGKKSYNRYFIIFQEEDKGFGIAIDKQPTGYTKIETRNGKCKITVYVQNLVKEKGPYVCCLIDSTKNPAVVARLGNITVDDTGRGETWWEYREDDIAETGMPVDRFNVSAVIVDGRTLLSPLAGFAGKDRIDWKARMVVKPAEVEGTEVKEVETAKAEPDMETVELDEEAKKFEEYEASIKEDAVIETEAVNENVETDARPLEEKEVEAGTEPAREEEKVETVETGAEPIIEEEKVEIVETGAEPAIEEEKDDKVEVDAEPVREKKPEEAETEPYEIDDYSEVVKKYEEPAEPVLSENVEEENGEGGIEDAINIDMPRHRDEYYEKEKEKRTYASIFHKLLKDFEEIEDISEELKGSRWWKIPCDYDVPVREDRMYPYFCTIYHLKMAYPYINYIKYIKKTGYYYFGIKYDDDGEVKFIMYGIEGKYNTNDQPYMGMTGFAKWVKLKKKDMGMWIMHYNPYTGCILMPKRR